MMKKTNLMIGDYVQVLPDIRSHCNHFGYSKIKELRECDLDTEDIIELKYTEIVPIPLYTIILIKNGFKPKGMCNTLTLVKDSISLSLDDKGNWKFKDITISYVHELQHVFKIFKINIKLKL
jgi:hypothetical protein